MKRSFPYLTTNQKQYLLNAYRIVNHKLFRKNKKYSLAVCCIVKDENEYLEEWIKYHHKIGIDVVYIYDNDSNISVEQFLKQKVFSKEVKIETISGKGMQVEAYNRCLKKFGKVCEWIAFIDVDEFIVCKTTNNLKTFLKKFEGYGGLGINWITFGSSNHIFKPSKPQIESFTFCTDRSEDINLHIKSIIQPQYVVKPSIDPHSFIYKRYEYCVDENSTRIDGPFNINSTEKIQINHYYVRSEEEFRSKINRGAGDGIAKRTMKDFEEINVKCCKEDFSILNLIKNLH